MTMLIMALCLSASPMDYAAFQKTIGGGATQTAYSNVQKPAGVEGVEVVIPGTTGVYRCWKAKDGRLMMQEVPAQKPATFRQAGVPVHRSHNCPVCGRNQYAIAGWNRDGTHTHTCSAGHSWRH